MTTQLKCSTFDLLKLNHTHSDMALAYPEERNGSHFTNRKDASSRRKVTLLISYFERSLQKFFYLNFRSAGSFKSEGFSLTTRQLEVHVALRVYHFTNQALMQRYIAKLVQQHCRSMNTNTSSNIRPRMSKTNDLQPLLGACLGFAIRLAT